MTRLRRCHDSMAARRDKSSQVVAVLFIALLAGGECARISDQVQYGLEQAKSLMGQDGAIGPFFWWHNDVCRSRELNSGNVSAASSRYVLKFVKLQQLEASLRSDKCANGCATHWIEFKSRVTHFKSCTSVLSEAVSSTASAGVSGLVDVLTADNTSFTQLMTDSLVVVATAMQKRNMFPVGEKCGFFPARLNITGALDATKNASEAGNVMREELFGKECDSEAAEQYMNSLHKGARRTVNATMAMVDRVVELAHRIYSGGEKDEELVKQEVTKVAVDTKAIVADIKSEDNNGDDQTKVKKVEEFVETKQVLEDGGGRGIRETAAAALLEVHTLTMAVNDYTFFEVFIGVLIAVLFLAFIGAFAAPVITSFQANFAAAGR